MSSTRSPDPRAPATDPRWAAAAAVLCAHGIAGGPGVARDHAAALAGRGLFAEVRACCLAGAPGLAETLAAIDRPRIFLAPLLMAEGYAMGTLLPRALGNAPADRVERVMLARPVGTSPVLADMIADRAAAACRDRGWPPAETAVLLVGHGTTRDSASGATAREQAARLAATGRFAETAVAFLEATPTLAEALARLGPRPCVAIGFFADAGAHGEADVPRLLAQAGAGAAYAGPVGTDARMVDAVLERLRAGR